MKMKQIKSLKELNKIPYFLDAYAMWNTLGGKQVMLVDDHYYQGWTRKEVEQLSGKVYNYLLQKGIGKDDFVMLCLPRGVLPVIAMIGVWKAGAAFVTVEDDYAAERIAFIKKDCGCKLTIDLDLLVQIRDNVKYKRGYVRADDHDACFAIYTSGSTGRPKGVVHEYGNIKLNATLQNIDVPKGTRAALIAPLNFIASIKMVLGLLYAPATLYVVPYFVVKNPRKLVEYFLESQINLTFLSPSMIRAVGNNFGPYLKVIETGSEPANGIYLDGIKLVNNYAMSEGAFTVCQFEIDRPYDVCPVGKPAAPCLEISLLDEDGNPVKQGEQGEICFPNPFMRGYMNMPEQTAEAMRGGLYHTGDLGYQNEDGNIVLVGRSNEMIKINGNRIEPAEIEAAFKQVTGKDWCAAKGFEAPDQSYVCVYYLGELEQTEEEIRSGMEEHVPYYMIPSFFVQIEHVPLLENGKLARKELPDPRVKLERKEYVAPRDELELSLCHAFEQVLGVKNIGITEDFYDLGGSSVKAMQLLAIMDLGSLSAVDVYQGRTVEQIANIYRDKTEGMENLSEEEKEMRARQEPRQVPVAQRMVIDSQLNAPKKPMWIVPFLVSFGPDADAEALRDAAEATSINHPIFSTVFEFGEDFELQQRYDESKRVPIELEVMTDAEFEELRNSPLTTMRLIGQPMVRLRVIKTDSNVYVMFVFHHIVMDGSSVHLIAASLLRAYMGLDLELDTYFSYLEDEERLSSTSAYVDAYRYYRDNYEGVDWCRVIEPDKAEAGNTSAFIPIPTAMTPANLAAMEKRCGITANGFVNAMASLALAKMSGKSDVVTAITFHNRVDERRKHAGGMLFRFLPLGVHFDQVETLADLYATMNEQTQGAIAHSTYNWLSDTENTYMNDIFAVIYETAAINDTSGLAMIGAKMETMNSANEAAIRRNSLQLFETEDSITVLLYYMASIYSEERINEFARVFAGYVDSLVDVADPSQVKVADLLA